MFRKSGVWLGDNIIQSFEFSNVKERYWWTINVPIPIVACVVSTAQFFQQKIQNSQNHPLTLSSIIASTANFSQYCAVMMAMVGWRLFTMVGIAFTTWTRFFSILVKAPCSSDLTRSFSWSLFTWFLTSSRSQWRSLWRGECWCTDKKYSGSIGRYSTD